MNSQRLEVVDFTVTVIKSQICLYIKKPEAQVVFKRSGYMKVGKENINNNTITQDLEQN